MSDADDQRKALEKMLWSFVYLEASQVERVAMRYGFRAGWQGRDVAEVKS